MSINSQLHLITYCFVGLLVLLLMFACLIGFLGFNLTQRQQFVEHTNEILEQVEITERLYTEADYQGRLRLSTGNDIEDLQPNREKVLRSIENLRAKVNGNSAQAVRCDSLTIHVKQRFALQDEQFRGRRINGATLEFDKTLVAQNNEFGKTIEVLFANLQLNEFNHLRLERMPNLYWWQWVIVYFAAGVLILLFAVSSVLFFLNRRILKRNLRVGRKMDETLHNGAKDYERQLEKFRDLILETNDPLTS